MYPTKSAIVLLSFLGFDTANAAVFEWSSFGNIFDSSNWINVQTGLIGTPGANDTLLLGTSDTALTFAEHEARIFIRITDENESVGLLRHLSSNYEIWFNDTDVLELTNDGDHPLPSLVVGGAPLLAETAKLTIRQDRLILNGEQVELFEPGEFGTLKTKRTLISQGSNDEGEIVVSGREIRWVSSKELVVGHAGTGKLTVEDGAKIVTDPLTSENSNGALIGGLAGSMGDATVSGEGSEWREEGVFFVGRDTGSTGLLTILDQGKVSANFMQVGGGEDGRSPTGSVTLEDDGNLEVNRLAIGDGGIGIVTADFGSTVFIRDSMILGGNGGTGVFEIEGLSSANIGTSATDSIPGATIVSQGGLIGGTGRIGGNVILNGGTLSPGSSPGSLFIDGNLEVLDGKVDFEYFGNQQDEISVSGDFHLADLSFLDIALGAQLEIGDVITLASVGGSFSGGDLTQIIQVFTPQGSQIDIRVDFQNGELQGSVVAVEQVPLPGSAILLLSGLIFSRFIGRSRDRAATFDAIGWEKSKSSKEIVHDI